MSENLELRRQALESTGWTNVFICYFGWLHGTPPAGHGDLSRLGSVRFCSHISDEHNEKGPSGYLAPAVESDPGVSEPWFLEWCGKNGYRWVLQDNDGGNFGIILFDKERDKSLYVVEVSGRTPSEARAFAVIAAATKGQP